MLAPMADWIDPFAVAQSVHTFVDAESRVECAQCVRANRDHVGEPGDKRSCGDIEVGLQAIGLRG